MRFDQSIGVMRGGTGSCVSPLWNGWHFCDAFEGEPCTFFCAMIFDGLMGIGGAGGVEATILAEKRGDCGGVGFYECEEDFFHTRLKHVWMCVFNLILLDESVIDRCMAEKSKKSKIKTINLALQGGGSHGAFTWGVVDALLEDGRIDFEGVSATSAGAMNAAALAQGLRCGGADEARTALEEFWHAVIKSGSVF